MRVSGILDRSFGMLDDFFGIAQPFFCFPRDLFVDALGFLRLVSDQFPGFLLYFAGEVFGGARDLMFVHGDFP